MIKTGWKKIQYEVQYFRTLIKIKYLVFFLSGLSIAHKDDHIAKKHFKIELDEKSSNFEPPHSHFAPIYVKNDTR